MFTQEELSQYKGFLRIGLNKIDIVIIKAALELLGIADMEAHLNREMTEEEVSNFIEKKFLLEDKINSGMVRKGF